MRVLVVEDEERLLQLLAKGLGEHGYAVDTATDGESGLHLALVEPYDLIVLDVMLPKLDGIALCRQLRSKGRNIPVLMLTARDTIDDRVDGLDAGADDYLVKPFAFRELAARARALLRRDAGNRDPVIRIADLAINTVTREVWRADAEIHLTSKEYALLELFAHNPNRVLTRSQIAEHIWDFSFVAMSNVVDVYIGYLRRKLGDDQAPRLIHTIRGVGYQLRAPKTS